MTVFLNWIKISLSLIPFFYSRKISCLVPALSVSREVSDFYRVDHVDQGKQEQSMEKIPRAAEKE